MEVSTIGLDLAKNVFQVHGVDASGRIVIRKAIRRSQVLPFFAKLAPCLVGIEACGTSHHWARGLLSLGHDVRLMPPAYVKPYVKRSKTDAADAEAICEAVTRPTMRFVPVKSREQQAILSMHRTRDLLVKQRTQLVNMMRGQLAEFGINIPQGLERALMLARQIVEGKEVPDLPGHAVKMLAILSRQTLAADEQIREINRDLLVLQKATRWLVAWRPFRDWSDRSNRLCRCRDRSRTVQVRPPIRRVARPDTAAELERRQGTSRPDQQDGRQISAPSAGNRSNRAGSAVPEQARQGHAAFCVAAGEKAGAGRDRRHGQQDGADRLGADDARRNISRSTYPDTGCVGDNRFSRATLAA